MVTEQELRERVVYWQGVLEPLGITHWRITSIKIVDHPTAGDDDTVASIWKSSEYDSCRIEFSRSKLDNTEEVTELDEFIVHEWLHVAFRDFDVAAASVVDDLSPAAASFWGDRMHHEYEGLIDRLARLIVALHDF